MAGSKKYIALLEWKPGDEVWAVVCNGTLLILVPCDFCEDGRIRSADGRQSRTCPDCQGYQERPRWLNEYAAFQVVIQGAEIRDLSDVLYLAGAGAVVGSAQDLFDSQEEADGECHRRTAAQMADIGSFRSPDRAEANEALLRWNLTPG